MISSFRQKVSVEFDGCLLLGLTVGRKVVGGDVGLFDGAPDTAPGVGLCEGAVDGDTGDDDGLADGTLDVGP